MKTKKAKPVKQLDMMIPEEALTTEGEFVQTPAWLTNRLLDHVGVPVGAVLDAGAGLGAISNVLLGRAHREDKDKNIRITAMELYEARVKVMMPDIHPVQQDFMLLDEEFVFNYVFTNPPFSIWYEWVDKCIKHLAGNGSVYALGPYSNLANNRPWWLKHNCIAQFIPDKRPWELLREVAWYEFKKSAGIPCNPIVVFI